MPWNEFQPHDPICEASFLNFSTLSEMPKTANNARAATLLILEILDERCLTIASAISASPVSGLNNSRIAIAM